ncbi:MAG TPA: phage holin family protein [Myxococcota bacterium]|nr:phage holin family protein [Myxococcota bacterium]
MKGFLLRWAISALGLWLADQLLAGLSFDSPGTLAAAALLLGIVNAVVRPLAVFFTLPATLVTLGLFLLVINAAMLGLVAALLDGFHIAGFWSALGGWIVVSLTSWLASGFVGERGRVEVIVARGR